MKMLVRLIGLKGSSRSGNFGHAGRPGVVGGSSATDKIPTVSTIDELSDIDGIKLYFITNMDKLVDVADYTHPGFMSLKGAAKLLGIQGSKYERIVNFYNKPPNLRKIVNDALLNKYDQNYLDIQREAVAEAVKNGVIRVNVDYGNTHIQTANVTDAILHRLQGLFYGRKLDLSDDGEHVWEGIIANMYKRFTKPQFLMADHVTDLSKR
jgi:hypothetical protein